MKKLIAALCFLTIASTLYAAGRRYTISDIANPEAMIDNTIAINENFADLCRDKEDDPDMGELPIPRFIITDLDDPERAEENAFAIMENFYDLYRFKQGDSGPSSQPRYVIEGLMDEDKAELNDYKINTMFDDLWAEKKDK